MTHGRPREPRRRRGGVFLLNPEHRTLPEIPPVFLPTRSTSHDKKNLRLRNPNHTICSLYPPEGTLPAGDTLAASARNQQHTRSIIGSTN